MNFLRRVSSILLLVLINLSVQGQGQRPELLPHYALRFAWSSQGDRYATGHVNGDIRIYDAGAVTRVIPSAHTELILALDFSPSGSRLVTGAVDGAVRIWNADTGVLLHEFSEIWGEITALDWSPDGSLIFVTPFGINDFIVSADIATDSYSISQTTELAGSDGIAWNPQSTAIAVGGTLLDLSIFDTTSGSTRVLDFTPNSDRMDPPNEFITSVAWHPTANIVANGKINGRVLIWDLDAPSDTVPLHSLEGNNGATDSAIRPFYHRIVDIGFSSDGHTISSVSMDGTVRVWNAETGEMLSDINLGEQVLAGAFRPDGSQLVYSTYSTTDVPLVITNLPLAEAGLDQVVTDENNDDLELVTLDGSGSSDVDGTIVSYSWTANGTEIATGANPQVTLGVGSHTITLIVTDDDGLTDTDELVINIVELTPTATNTLTVTPSYTPTVSATFTPTPSLGCSTTIVASDVLGLASAISAANSNGSSVDTICLTATSTYTLTAVNNSTDGPNGLPSITTEIVIVGNGATITRDPAAPAFRIFNVAAGGSLILDGVTISGGSATSAAPGNDGGAIYNRGTVNLIGSTNITNSTANADGGAVYNRGTFNIAAGSSIAVNTAADDGGGVYTSSGTLIVTGGTITNNTAGDEGGGIRSVDSTITLTSANITDNTATGGSGGGLYTTSTTLTVTNGVFSGNGGNSGGGLYFTNSPSAASLDGVQIINNTGTNGGGLYLTSSGQATLTSVTVSGNQATSSAAGIWSGGTLTLTDSIVSNNGNTSQPGSAGGIRAAGATLTVSDTVISGNLVNSSSGSGGGVYIVSAGNIVINGGEISGNDARNGGGLYNSGNLSLSSIIDTNAAQHYGGGLYITGGITHVDGSVFSNNTAVDRGGAIYNGVTTASWIHNSCITGNTSADTGGIYSNTAAFDAIDNWWGAAGGPSGAGAGTGDAANSNVTFSPFLTAGCPSGTGEGDTQQLMGPQVQMRGAEPTPTLAPVRVPFRATFEDEVDWYAGGTWVLDTLNGRNKAPSWTVNTSSRGEESILEMRAPINLRGTQSPQLTFWERGQIAPSDVITVEVLPEGASTWTVVDIRSTVPSAWTQRSVSLSAYRGQTIQLRVRVVAGGELEGGARSVGLWIDDWGLEGR